MTLLQWQIQSGGIREFNWHRREWRDGNGFPSHSHDYFEVFWIDEGNLEHTWEGETELLASGDAVLIVPGETHALRALPRGKGAAINASMPASAILDLRRRYHQPGVPWLWDGPREHRRFVVPPGVREALRLMVGLADPVLPHGRDLLVLSLLHARSRAGRGGLDRLPAPIARAVSTALAEDPGISVAALAARLRRSREGLTRLARRHCGRPLAALLRDWRLDRAADLLRTTDQGIAHIATTSGFEALGGFYKAFHRRFGCPPGRWRLRS